MKYHSKIIILWKAVVKAIQYTLKWIGEVVKMEDNFIKMNIKTQFNLIQRFEIYF